MTKNTENNIIEIARIFGDQSIKATKSGATLHLDEIDLNLLARVLDEKFYGKPKVQVDHYDSFSYKAD